MTGACNFDSKPRELFRLNVAESFSHLAVTIISKNNALYSIAPISSGSIDARVRQAWAIRMRSAQPNHRETRYHGVKHLTRRAFSPSRHSVPAGRSTLRSDWPPPPLLDPATSCVPLRRVYVFINWPCRRKCNYYYWLHRRAAAHRDGATSPHLELHVRNRDCIYAPAIFLFFYSPLFSSLFHPHRVPSSMSIMPVACERRFSGEFHTSPFILPVAIV